MNISSAIKSNSSGKYILIIISISLFSLLIGACRAVPKSKRAEYKMRHETPYQSTNIYTAGQMPENIRRVAILPVNLPQTDNFTSQALQQNVASQANRTNLFEAVIVNTNDLQRYVGKDNINSTEELPSNFMSTMLNVYGADAVLFTDITSYDPYKPVKIGLRSKLMSVRDNKPIWAFDDHFDSGDPRVTSGALRYEQASGKQQYPHRKTTNVLQSPLQFSSYVFATAYATMPQRNRPLPTVPQGYQRSVTSGKSTGRTPGHSSTATIPELP